MHSRISPYLFAAILLGASTAAAVDGVIEINQASAIAGGVTPADSAGFPVTLTSGSFRLTSDLATSGSSAFVGGTSNNVTLDLNGFTVDGETSSGTGVQLSNGNNWEVRNGTIRRFNLGVQQSAFSDGHRLIGLRVNDNATDGIVVLNGVGHLIADSNLDGNLRDGIRIGNRSVVRNTIVTESGGVGIGTVGAGSGWLIEGCSVLGNTSHGLKLGDRATVIRTRSEANGGHGIEVGNDSLVSESVANGNREDGIRVGSRSRVAGNIANTNAGAASSDGIEGGNAVTVIGNSVSENAAFGIRVVAGATIAQNVASDNGNDGITTGNGCTVVGNSAYSNDDDGITAFSSVIRDNSTYLNGDDGIAAGEGCIVSDNASFENGGDGIQVLNGTSVQRNTVRINTGFGLRFNTAPSASYRENTISDNTGGTVSGASVNMGDNSCNGAATCP